MSLRRLFKGATDPAPRTVPCYDYQQVVQITGGYFKGEVGMIVGIQWYPETTDKWLYRICIDPDAYMPRVWESELTPYSKPVKETK